MWLRWVDGSWLVREAMLRYLKCNRASKIICQLTFLLTHLYPERKKWEAASDFIIASIWVILGYICHKWCRLKRVKVQMPKYFREPAGKQTHECDGIPYITCVSRHISNDDIWTSDHQLHHCHSSQCLLFLAFVSKSAPELGVQANSALLLRDFIAGGCDRHQGTSRGRCGRRLVGYQALIQFLVPLTFLQLLMGL